MWVITGPFDGEEQGKLDVQKSKLLKTGKTYKLGRKDTPLVINHKVISKAHGEFKVWSYTMDNVLDPSIVPNMEFFNERKDKVMRVTRGEEVLSVNPSATVELQDGDTLYIANNIPVTLSWQRVCCFSPPIRGKTTIEACASLGISLSYTWSPEVTHHLTTHYAITPVIATSLITLTQFVKPEWLDEVIRLGDLPVNNPSNGTSLEQLFTLPPLTKFRPSLPASLPHALKRVKPWEPNEERVNMFRGLKFVFVDENESYSKGELKELVLHGNGECESFTVSSGKAPWRQVLGKWKGNVKKGKDTKKGLVLVADQKAMKVAIGTEEWEELVQESKSFGLRFIAHEKILHSVVHVDLSYVDCSTDIHDDEADQRSSSPLPDFVGNTHPEEPSLGPPSITPVPGPSKKLIKRGISRPPSPPPPPEDPEDIQMAPPRKPLTRRAKGIRPVIIGIDDPSFVLDIEPDIASQKVPASEAVVSQYDIDVPIPARSSRLKRRAGTAFAASESQPFPSTSAALESSSGPPLKKFKELFEASDPDKMSSEEYQTLTSGTSNFGSNNDRQTQLQSMTESESAQTEPLPRGGLEVVAEEEEESLGQGEARGGGDGRRAKRKAGGLNDGDMDNADAGEVARAKKRAVENVNAVQPTTTRSTPGAPSTTVKSIHHKAGAAPGKPDTDTAFLKALASTKRGKKTEDQFDHQFNQLKISKPDLAKDEREEEWALLDTFGEEKNLRGNFMVVVEMEVFKRVDGGRRGSEVVGDWQFRPNFKKFKRKVVPGRRSAVELVPSEENDYGMGSAYWKTRNSQAQSQSLLQNDTFTVPKQTRLPIKSQQLVQSRRGKGRAISVDSDEEAIEQVVPRKGKQAGSSQYAPLAKTTRSNVNRPTRAREKSLPLFMESDDENDNEARNPSEHDLDTPGALGDDGAMILQTSAKLGAPIAPPKSLKVPSNRAKKAPAVAVVDDDSDDGAAFKGFKGRRTRSRK